LEEDPEPHTDRVKISIDYNLVNSPITREELARYPEFAGLKIGNQGTNFSATQSQYDKMETLAKQKNSRLNTQNDQTVLPYLNTIFFGPPGTGKTYRLKENFFDLFTEKGKHESSRIFRDLIKKGLLSKFEE
jgi:5-methylcytosine-specific restriction protein B